MNGFKLLNFSFNFQNSTNNYVKFEPSYISNNSNNNNNNNKVILWNVHYQGHNKQFIKIDSCRKLLSLSYFYHLSPYHKSNSKINKEILKGNIIDPIVRNGCNDILSLYLNNTCVNHEEDINKPKICI